MESLRMNEQYRILIKAEIISHIYQLPSKSIPPVIALTAKSSKDITASPHPQDRARLPVNIYKGNSALILIHK